MTEQLEERTLIMVFWGGRYRETIRPDQYASCLKRIREEHPEVTEVEFRVAVGRTGKGS